MAALSSAANCGKIAAHFIQQRDQPLSRIDQKSWRRMIGYVPQEVFLFSDTVGNNIAFGAGDADTEAIERAALEADLAAETPA